MTRCWLCFLSMPTELDVSAAGAVVERVITDGHGLGECVTICGRCLGSGCRRCLWSGYDRERVSWLRQLVSSVWINGKDWRWILFRQVTK